VAGDEAADEQEPTQCPVGIIAEAPTEDRSTYLGRKQAALNWIEALFGHVVVVKKGRLSLEWKVVAESNPDTDLGDDSDDGDTGLGLKNLSYIKKADYRVLLAHLFLTLTFQNWKRKVEKLNTLVDAHNLKGVRHKIHPFTEAEFLWGFGIIIGAAGKFLFIFW
jgi:hypothetical protein